MLKVLLGLAIAGLILSFVMNVLARKKIINGWYVAISLLQGACLGAMVGLLIVLLSKGRMIV
ncbi:hypothetical protein [Enterococcus sp. AZ196]|uniref:hypothetical protein n=1 Tax=Enterococcus sp. AZ196 TaxID=2774659 RepID=UPI003D2A2561